MDIKKLNVARRRYWKILTETGDDCGWESSGGEEGVMNASLEDLLHDADCLRDNYIHNGLSKGDRGYEIEFKIMKKYERFIERFS